MKKALALLAALSIVHYPLSILHAGTNAFVTVNTNTFQLSNLGFSTGGAGILWSNSATGAWGQIPTNSHIHLTDEHGSTYDFRTNGTLAISNLNGSYVTITNGNVTISGNFIGNGSMLTGVSGGGGGSFAGNPTNVNTNGASQVTITNVGAVPGTVTYATNSGTAASVTGTLTNNLSGNAAYATNAATAINFTGLLSGDVAGPQGATSVQTCQSNAILTNQFKYLFGFGDSYMAGDYAGIVTQTTTWYGQTPQTDYSQGYLFQAGSNCNLIISNWGFPGETAPYIWAVDEEEEQLYPPPTNAEFVVNSGLNDWYDNNNLQLTTYAGEMMTLIAWPEFGPEAKIFPTNNSGGGIVTSTNGYFIGSGWTETYWVANGSLNGGIYSTNKTNCIVVSNIIGRYFFVDIPGFGDGTGGTNVLYDNGVSNCLISCNTYPDEYWSGQGIPYQMIGTMIDTGNYTNHTFIFSNATGCIVGYSGANLNVGVEWIGVVSQIVNPHPVYVLSTAFTTQSGWLIPASYNLVLQTNVVICKTAGLPMDYVDYTGLAVLNPYNGNSAGNLHPGVAGHSAIANLLAQHVKNNAAFDGLRTGTAATNNLPGLLPQLSIGNGAGMTTVSAVTGNFGSITTTGASTFDTGANVDGFGGSITVADNITSTAGNIQATTGNFTGSGSGFTSLNASALATGTVPLAVLPTNNATVSSNIYNGNGAGLTNISREVGFISFVGGTIDGASTNNFYHLESGVNSTPATAGSSAAANFNLIAIPSPARTFTALVLNNSYISPAGTNGTVMVLWAGGVPVAAVTNTNVSPTSPYAPFFVTNLISVSVPKGTPVGLQFYDAWGTNATTSYTSGQVYATEP